MSYRSAHSGMWVAIAGIGWVLLCGAQTPTKRPLPQSRAEAPAKFTPYANYNPDPCYSDGNHDAADLCAQWRAAIAAEKAAHESRRATNWSILATLLNLATVGGLIITIWQTRGALREARRGNRLNLLFERRSRREAKASASDQQRALKIASQNAEAAIALVGATERHARIRLRAYIAIDNAGIQTFQVGSPLKALIVPKNSGQTPAIGFVSVSAVMLGPKDTPPSFPLPPDLSRLPKSDLGAGGTTEMNSSSIELVTQEQYEQAMRGELVAYARGVITFHDVFGEKHDLQFLAESCALGTNGLMRMRDLPAA